MKRSRLHGVTRAALMLLLLTACAGGGEQEAAVSEDPTAGLRSFPPTTTPPDAGAPIPTPTPLGPTVENEPYPAGGAFFAAIPTSYDRDPTDTDDQTVFDTQGGQFRITTGDRTLNLADGRAFDVPAETPIHGSQCLSLLTQAEMDFLVGMPDATPELAANYGATDPCGVYGMVEGTTVRWLEFEQVHNDSDAGFEELIPLGGEIRAVSEESFVLTDGLVVPRAEGFTFDCFLDGTLEEVLEEGAFIGVSTAPGADGAVFGGCFGVD
ncbi:hypothetical protein [Euzebya tangerina]|uniref:hypothetical protein n=1 Tax=Euzebya tangerina TaxID=591198 RepID=UPI0013C2C37F|nr:hypothetical protein [Euzebya tangerina]